MPMPGSCGPVTPPCDRAYQRERERITDRDVVNALLEHEPHVAQKVLERIIAEIPDDAVLEHLTDQERDYVVDCIILRRLG